MNKLFVYNVNGTIIEDISAFGSAWEKAKELATKEHCAITRQTVYGSKVQNEFYAKGGCFLDEKFYNVEKVKIF